MWPTDVTTRCQLRRVVAAASTVSEGSNGATGVSTLDAPKPAVQIDNQTDPFSTIVSIQYGDRLGELLDTVCTCAVQIRS